jgi:hypothetical protein
VKSLSPAPDTILEQGDVMVLFGSDDTIGAAEIQLLQGWRSRGRFGGRRGKAEDASPP